jgi:hypothetical protein
MTHDAQWIHMSAIDGMVSRHSRRYQHGYLVRSGDCSHPSDALQYKECWAVVREARSVVQTSCASTQSHSRPPS